jgi:hypothetical protein
MHNELPDCLVPYKRLCAEILENVVNGAYEMAPCEGRTIRRIQAWWSIAGAYFLRVLKAAYEKLKIPCPDAPAFKEIVRAAVNTNGWIFARSLCTRSVSVS